MKHSYKVAGVFRGTKDINERSHILRATVRRTLAYLFVQGLEARSIQRENERRQEVPATGLHS